MTEKEMMDLILNTVMSGDPLKVQATLMTVKDEYNKVVKEVAELKQQETINMEKIGLLTQDLDKIKNEKETIAQLYHEKWKQEPIDSKVKEEPEIVDPDQVVEELFK